MFPVIISDHNTIDVDCFWHTHNRRSEQPLFAEAAELVDEHCGTSDSSRLWWHTAAPGSGALVRVLPKLQVNTAKPFPSPSHLPPAPVYKNQRDAPDSLCGPQDKALYLQRFFSHWDMTGIILLSATGMSCQDEILLVHQATFVGVICTSVSLFCIIVKFAIFPDKHFCLTERPVSLDSK